MPFSAYEGSNFFTGNGSESSPSYSFSSSKTVGFFRLPNVGGLTSHSGVGFASNSLTRMVIDLNGNIGVGSIPTGVTVSGYALGNGGSTSNQGFTAARFNIMTTGTSAPGNLLNLNFIDSLTSYQTNFYTSIGSGTTGWIQGSPGTSPSAVVGRSLDTRFESPQGSFNYGGDFSWSNSFGSFKLDYQGRFLVNYTNAPTINLYNLGYQYPRLAVGGSAWLSDSLLMGSATVDTTSTQTNPFFRTNVSGTSYNIYGFNASNTFGTGVYLTVGNTSWTASSDERLKNITGEFDNAIDDIMKIKPVKFTWKNDTSATPRVGVIAQSVQAVLPEVIDEQKINPDDETTYLGVRYTEMIPLLIASIQELKKKNDELETRLEAVSAK
jgi:hypothetical protein